MESGSDLSGGKVLGFKRQLDGAVWSWSNLPNRGLNGITRLDGRSKSDSVISQRIWVVVSDSGHNRPGDETKCT